MKKVIYIFAILVSIFCFVSLSYAADNGPGDPPSEPQPGDDPIGGGAPIGGGTLILIGLAAGYGAKKVFKSEDKESL